jgi:hypothetical protein
MYQSNVEWLRSGNGALRRLLDHHVIQPTVSETGEIIRCRTAKFRIPVVLPVPLEEHRIEVKWRLKPGSCWNKLPLFLHYTEPGAGTSCNPPLRRAAVSHLEQSISCC